MQSTLGKSPDRAHTSVRLGLWLCSTAWLLIVLPQFLKALARGQFTTCKSNLRQLATALEMYASDNGGRYPGRLETLLEGRYLKAIPTCPAAGAVTYLDYRCATYPDVFTISCTGDNHWQAWPGHFRPNYPNYDQDDWG